MLTRWSGIGMIEGSGKLQGTVMFKGRSGAMARVNTKGVNPRTNVQIQRRASLSTNAQAWRALTPEQRAAWNSAASSGAFPQTNRLGVTYNPTGSQLYVKLNINIALCGQSVIFTPPAKQTLPQMLLTSATAAAGTPALSLVYSGAIVGLESLVIYATPNLSAGVSRPGDSQFRFITAYGGNSPANLLAAYSAVFGNPVEGQKIFLKALVIGHLSGQSIQAGSVSCIVAA